MPPPLPSRIGRYEVVDRLGSGGMGVVYLATDSLLQRTVALKVLPYATDDLRERFEREARSVAALRHPNVVTIYDIGEADGQPFIAMEFLDGETVAELIARRAPLDLVRRLRLMVDLCAGLGHAHGQGLVHRDVKPANLMVTAHGLKILDFGLARVTSTGHGALTRTGSVAGTAHYMAPEQVEGKTVDSISEVFSVGLVIYEVIAHARAFPGDSSPVVLYDIVHKEPRPLRELVTGLDPHLEAVVNRAMEKHRSRRYQSVGQLEADLQRVCSRLSRVPDESTVFELGPIADAPDATAVPSLPPATPRAARHFSLDQIAQRRSAQIEQRVSAAAAHLDEGRFEAAIAECEEALLLDANHARALDLLTRAHIAIEDAQLGVWIGDGRRHLTAGELTAAEDLAAKALRVRADAPEALALQREVQEQRRDRERAAELARVVQGAVDRARRSLEEGAFEAALRSASEALAYQSGHLAARALKQRAQTAIDERRRQQEHELAAIDLVEQAQRLATLEDFDGALALLNGFVPPHALVSDAMALVNRQHEAFLERQRDEKERRQKAVEQERRKERASEFREDARSAIARGAFADALGALERARQEVPGDPDLQTVAMEIDRGREAATAATRQRLALTRHLSEAAHALELGNVVAAASAVDAALALVPDDPEALRLRTAVDARAAQMREQQRQEEQARDAIAATRERLEDARRQEERIRLEWEKRRAEEQRKQEEPPPADEGHTPNASAVRLRPSEATPEQRGDRTRVVLRPAAGAKPPVSVPHNKTISGEKTVVLSPEAVALATRKEGAAVNPVPESRPASPLDIPLDKGSQGPVDAPPPLVAAPRSRIAVLALAILVLALLLLIAWLAFRQITADRVTRGMTADARLTRIVSTAHEPALYIRGAGRVRPRLRRRLRRTATGVPRRRGRRSRLRDGD